MTEHGVSQAATGTLADDGVPGNDVQEPLLPSQPQHKSALLRLADGWTQSVRGAWMAMCGYLRDPATGAWTDGGEPRTDGALPSFITLSMTIYYDQAACMDAFGSVACLLWLPVASPGDHASTRALLLRRCLLAFRR